MDISTTFTNTNNTLKEKICHSFYYNINMKAYNTINRLGLWLASLYKKLISKNHFHLNSLNKKKFKISCESCFNCFQTLSFFLKSLIFN